MPHDIVTRLQSVAGVCRAVMLILVALAGAGPGQLMAQSDPGERAAIEIITINYRDPTQIRQQIAPVLDPRGSIGQVDNKLVIASTAANLVRLKELIGQADTPPRRLVVSVDFEHDIDNPLLNSSRQQSAQAIEGDELLITDEAQTAQNLAGSQASILLVAEVRDQTAAVNFQLNNVPGLMGRHTVQIPLGVWYVINPDDELSAEDPDSPEPVVQADTRKPVAVRVDALP